MSILFVILFAAVAAQENPILLASKDFLNDVIAEDKHLTMHYVIHNIGTEVANDVVVSVLLLVSCFSGCLGLLTGDILTFNSNFQTNSH